MMLPNMMLPVQGMDLMLTILESPVPIYMITIQPVMTTLVITLSKLIVYTLYTVTWSWSVVDTRVAG